MRYGLFISLLLLAPAAAAAQTLDDFAGSAAAFTLSVSPQYPAPESSATLSVLSSTLDLANATMTVVVDGKNIYQGAVQPLAVPLGKAGSVTSVAVTLSSGGAQYRQTALIQPQDVALAVEPVSSAPALYPGKPLVPIEGNVRTVAVANLRNANGKAIDPNALSYSWTVDGMHIANASGIGKKTIIVASPLQYRSRTVAVTVASQDGSLTGGASFSLTAQEPSVRIYESDPLLGIRFSRALFGAYAIAGAEATLYAAPFSLPTTGGAPLLQWFLNGAAAQTGNAITLRPTGSGRGNASLSLVASSGDYAKATANLSLSFGDEGGFNLFGL